MSDNESLFDNNLFEEPEDFRPPPPQEHFTKYGRKSETADPKEIQLKLIGSSPLWGHLLWNAGIYTANHLDTFAKEICEGKNILELGAAAGLPSIIAGLNKANKVVCTDYPDLELQNTINTIMSLLKDIFGEMNTMTLSSIYQPLPKINLI